MSHENERALNDQLWADAQAWISEADPELIASVSDLLEAEDESVIRDATEAEIEVIQSLARLALREAAMRKYHPE